MTRTTSKAARLAELVERLERRPLGVGQLAKAFGVTRRTIERDLDALRAMGKPIEERDHRYFLPTSPTALNDVEALAVHSATRLLVHTGVGERHYRHALEKLAKQLPEPARATLLRSVDDLEPDVSDRTLDLVAQAWFQGRVLRCTYRSVTGGGRARPNELEIYFYEINRRNLEPYVIARERLHHASVRVFKLSRIESAHLLADTYAIPDDFDPNTFLSRSWGIVVGPRIAVTVRVQPQVAFWFKERKEPHLAISEEHPDGSLIVRIEASVGGNGEPLELVPWLLGWGANVEVLSPDSVRERIRSDVRAAAAVYGGEEGEPTA